MPKSIESQSLSLIFISRLLAQILQIT